MYYVYVALKNEHVLAKILVILKIVYLLLIDGSQKLTHELGFFIKYQ